MRGGRFSAGSRLVTAAAAVLAVCCLAVCEVSGVDVTAEMSEEALVDRIAAADNETDADRQMAESPQAETADSQSRQRYVTNTGYIIPMRSSASDRPDNISDSEMSVYVAIGILTLIAFALIIAGSIFCYKYSAALRASESAQPIILGGGGSSSGSGSGQFPQGDDKLARHAQRAYYQRQKQNITAAFGDKNRLSKSSIPEEDSDQDDHNVYGCQGLASTSGLEVTNPMFKGAASDED